VARLLKSPRARKMQSTTEHTGPSAVYGSGQGEVERGGEGKVVARLRSGGNRRDGGSRVSPFIKPALPDVPRSARPDDDTVRVGDLPIRHVPVIPAHHSMAAARKMALLKQSSLLLVERDDYIVGTIDERALAADHDLTAVAAAMRPLATRLRPATPVTEARELFIRARAAILPVVAGGLILGAVTRSDVERARS
jgi:CBS domain-containing protein